jgi:hypothetical protein
VSAPGQIAGNYRHCLVGAGVCDHRVSAPHSWARACCCTRWCTRLQRLGAGTGTHAGMCEYRVSTPSTACTAVALHTCVPAGTMERLLLLSNKSNAEWATPKDNGAAGAQHLKALNPSPCGGCLRCLVLTGLPGGYPVLNFSSFSLGSQLLALKFTIGLRRGSAHQSAGQPSSRAAK